MARRGSRKAEYVITTEVDSAGIGTGIAKVTSEFAELDEKGKDAFSGIQDGLGKFIGKLGASDKTVGKFGKIASGAFGGIDKALGGLPSGLLGMTKGIKGANLGFKAMKGAIASTGIGLLVIALGELVTYLMQSKTFIDVMNNALLRVKAVIKPTVDLVMSLGSALAALFSGKPGEAFLIASEAVTGYGSELVEAQKNVSALIAAQKELEALLKDGELAQARLNRESFKAQQIAKDRTASDEDRIKALKDILRLDKEVVQIDMKKVLLEKEILEGKSKLGKLSLDEQARLNELKVEELELMTDLDRIQDEYEMDLKDIEEDAADRLERAKRDRQRAKEDEQDILQDKAELLEELRLLRLSDEERELADAKRVYDERVAIAGDDFGLLKAAQSQYLLDKKAIDDDFRAQEKELEDQLKQEEADELAMILEAHRTSEESERERVRVKYEELFALAEKHGFDTVTLKKKMDAELASIAKKNTTKELKLAQDTHAKKAKFALQAVQALIDINRANTAESEDNARKRFEVDKAMGIGMATVNTAIAISDALAKDGVAPFSRFASAAMAGAAGLAQVLAIKNTTFDSPSSIDETSDYSSSSNMEAPQLDLSFMQEGAGQTGVQAYVVSNQMTNSQQAQQQIQDQASLVG